VADLFKEVDEDLRREKLEKLWKKFAPLIIGFAVLFIGGMAGRVYWVDLQEQQRIAESDRYQAALFEITTGRQSEALEALQEIAATSKYGYDLLAELQAASLLIQKGRVDEGLATYDSISSNSDFDRRYRDYAALLAAMVVLDQAYYDEATVRLEPLVRGDGSWAFSARELLGLMAMEKEDWAGAEATFLQLSLDPEAPEELQGRAREYLQMIDVKKPQTSLIDGESLAQTEETVAEESDAGTTEQ